MQTIIESLKNIAQGQTERKAKSINNLIRRIEFFQSAGDLVKIDECRAEALLWGAK